MEQLLRKERSDMADRIENEEIIISWHFFGWRFHFMIFAPPTLTRKSVSIDDKQTPTCVGKNTNDV